MERIEYDPEIDPTIREEREAAERERELVGRIRLEIERYVEENDLVPRVSLRTEEPPWETHSDSKAPKVPHSSDPSRQADEPEESEEEPQDAEEPKERKAPRPKTAPKTGGKTIRGMLTGSILTGEWMRRSWPYLAGFAVLLVLYIAHTFQLQKLHLERQQLETEVRELGIEAVRRTAERVAETRRSAIVERLAEENIPLEEFPHPVKTIER